MEFNLGIDLGLIKYPYPSNGRKIMQIVQKKPKTIAILKANKLLTEKKDMQTKRNRDALKKYICFKEFDTVKFETQSPRMTLITFPNSRTLTGSIYSPMKTGFTLLNLAVKNYPESGLELTETGSLINFITKTEIYSAWSGIDTRNNA